MALFRAKHSFSSEGPTEITVAKDEVVAVAPADGDDVGATLDAAFETGWLRVRIASLPGASSGFVPLSFLVELKQAASPLHCVAAGLPPQAACCQPRGDSLAQMLISPRGQVAARSALALDAKVALNELRAELIAAQHAHLLAPVAPALVRSPSVRSPGPAYLRPADGARARAQGVLAVPTPSADGPAESEPSPFVLTDLATNGGDEGESRGRGGGGASSSVAQLVARSLPPLSTYMSSPDPLLSEYDRGFRDALERVRIDVELSMRENERRLQLADARAAFLGGSGAAQRESESTSRDAALRRAALAEQAALLRGIEERRRAAVRDSTTRMPAPRTRRAPPPPPPPPESQLRQQQSNLAAAAPALPALVLPPGARTRRPPPPAPVRGDSGSLALLGI